MHPPKSTTAQKSTRSPVKTWPPQRVAESGWPVYGFWKTSNRKEPKENCLKLMLQAEVAVLSVASRWWYFFGGGSICFAHRDPSAGAVRFPLKTQRRVPNVGVARLPQRPAILFDAGGCTEFQVFHGYGSHGPFSRWTVNMVTSIARKLWVCQGLDTKLEIAGFKKSLLYNLYISYLCSIYPPAIKYGNWTEPLWRYNRWEKHRTSMGDIFQAKPRSISGGSAITITTFIHVDMYDNNH